MKNEIHIMEGSFYSGKPVSEIPDRDIISFSKAMPELLKIRGWSAADIAAVSDEKKKRELYQRIVEGAG